MEAQSGGERVGGLGGETERLFQDRTRAWRGVPRVRLKKPHGGCWRKPVKYELTSHVSLPSEVQEPELPLSCPLSPSPAVVIMGALVEIQVLLVSLGTKK